MNILGPRVVKLADAVGFYRRVGGSLPTAGVFSGACSPERNLQCPLREWPRAAGVTAAEQRVGPEGPWVRAPG